MFGDLKYENNTLYSMNLLLNGNLDYKIIIYFKRVFDYKLNSKFYETSLSFVFKFHI